MSLSQSPRRAALAAALALFTLAALAPRPARAQGDAPAPTDPTFQALRTDGQTFSGRVRQFGPGGGVTLVAADGQERTFAAAELVKLSREGVIPPLNAEPSAVLFPDGDRLYRTALGAATETHLEVQSYSLGKVAIPLESLLGIVLALSTDPDALDALILRVRTEPRTSEILWLANGDKVVGGYLSLTEKSAEFLVDKKPLKVDRAGVGAIGFDPALVNYPRPAFPFYELTLFDGSRIGVRDATVDKGHVVATSRFGSPVRIPLTELVRAHSRTPSVEYLAEREPAAAKYVPYVGAPRPFMNDLNVEGQTFRLSGLDYDRGLGAQSRTLLAYRLRPGDRRFQATVGLDDRAGPLGNVVFKVLVDNQERFASPPMSARDGPRAVDVDLAGGKVLVLITEFGKRGNVRDLADWVEARIIR